MRLDHVVLACPDLAAEVARFASLTGIDPVRGGSHVGLGTANYLVGIGSAAYLEIVGPDLSRAAPAQPRPFAIDDLSEPRMCTWAVSTTDIAAQIARAQAAGYDPGPARAMSRATPDGELLSWQLTAPRLDSFGGLIPFLIDWGATPHPTSRDLPCTPLIALTARAPQPAAISVALAALGTELTVTDGPTPLLQLRLDTPNGIVAIT